MARKRGFIQATLLVLGMVAFAVPWRAASEAEPPDRLEGAAPCVLPPGHPVVACAPDGRPSARSTLPPGHPPVQGRRALPPGHPPIDGGASARPGVIQPAPLGGDSGSAPRVYAL